MIKDRNSRNTCVPTKEIQDFEKFLKRRKSFEDVFLQKIDKIAGVGNIRVNSTNYRFVSVVRVGNIFTYFARLSRKDPVTNKVFKWHDSFCNVLDAAKAVDKKLLEHHLPSVNFKLKPKAKEIVDDIKKEAA